METRKIHPAFRRGLTLALFLALCLTLLGASASASTNGPLTGFLDCTSGSATGYITYSDHFYKVEWTGINTSETSSVRLDSDSYGRLVAYRNGDSSSTTFLRVDASSSTAWPTSSITGLTPGQSSSGYTSFNKLATGASDSSRKKVCTITCVAALKPKWTWSDDHTSCTATFMCSADPNLTATLNAAVTSSGSNPAANVTFNGINYSYAPPVTYNINYALNGGINDPGNPATYRDDESITLADPTRTGYIFEGWYNYADFSGAPVTSIPYDSSGNRTFYAKWKGEIDGLYYDEAIGGFVIDSAEALNALANYGKFHNCSGKIFKQTADIALSGAFPGIGDSSAKFAGTYDGGGHIITGLSVTSDYGNAGLFRYCDHGTVENIILVEPSNNAAVTGRNGSCGGLIGSANRTRISNCIVISPTLVYAERAGYGNYRGAISGDGSSAYENVYTNCWFHSDDPTDGLRGVGNWSATTSWRMYKLTLSDGVSASSDGFLFSYDGAYYLTANSLVTLTITPEAGSSLHELSVKQGETDVELSETEDDSTRTFTMPAGDVNAEATFGPIEYHITYNYNLDGVTPPAGNPASYTVESAAITLVNPARAGYIFTGWTGDNGTTPQKTVTIPHGSTGDKTYTANWLEDHWGIAAGNDGSAEHPYLISDEAGLRYLATYVNNGNKTSGLLFLQTADIALNGVFTPIGALGDYNCPAFAGIYDGGGYVITGLSVDVSSPYAGLFGYIQNGTVKNVTVIEPNVRASWWNTRYAGGIVGNVKPGYIENCTVIDPTLSATYCGAICGGISARSSNIHDYTFYAAGNINAVGANLLQLPTPGTRIFTLSLGDGITTDTAGVFTYGGTDYYAAGTSVTLSHSDRAGYSFSYDAKDTDNNSVAVTGNSFSFPAKDVTVAAAYTPIVYSITYNGLDGAEFSTTHNSYTIESQTITLDKPTKTGYTFGGWYRNAGLTGDAVASIVTGSTGDMALWAKWTANTYTIHFEPNTDRASHTMTDQTFHYDQAATALSANLYSVTTGEFLGWNTAPDGTGTSYTDGQTVRNLTDKDGVTITLYGQWHLMNRINYDLNMFKCISDGTQSAYNQGAIYFAYPGTHVYFTTLNGGSYSYDNIAVTKQDGKPITPVKAEQPDLYDGFIMPDQDVWITADAYDNIDNARIYLDGVSISLDYAYVYDPQNPTVTPHVDVYDKEAFFDEDGELENDARLLTEGTEYSLSIINNAGNASGMVTATVTVTGMGHYVGVLEDHFRITPFDIASCTVNTPEIYDDGYGGLYPLEDKIQVWNGDVQLVGETLDYSGDIDFTVEIPQENYDASGQLAPGSHTAIIQGRGDWGGTKEFGFKVIEPAHTVVFDPNGGSGDMPNDTVEKGARYYVPECAFTAPRGMTFDHWLVNYNGIGEDPIKLPHNSDNPDYGPDYFTAPYIWSESDVQTITLTACWVEKDPYTLTASGLEHGSLMLNGETAELIANALDVYDGDRITVTADEGYTLALNEIDVTYLDENGETQSINVSPDETVPYSFSFVVPESDVTVNATIREIPKYTVSFAANGGGGTMEPAIIRSGNDFTLPACGFTDPTDKQFLEWSVQVGTAEAVRMDPGDSFTVTADTTVTPAWTTLYNITVTLDSDSSRGTLVPSKAKAVAGEVITLTEVPAEGYTLSRAADKLRATYELPNGGTVNLNSFDREEEELSFTMPEGNVTVNAAFISPWEQLQEMLNAGGTVTLNRNYAAAAGDHSLYIPENTSVTLNLNGFTLDASASGENVMDVYGALTLDDSRGGGKITGGSRDGAGVLVGSNASFTMNGGEISGNAAGSNGISGGGVYVNGNASFTMNGGVITGNTAPMGGGVSNWGSFTMNGGTITGNTATEENGGSGVAAYSSITLSGAARIDGNVGNDIALVYVEQDGTVFADSKIVVGGTLTGAAQHPINVCYMLGDTVPDPMVFTEGLSGKGSTACFNSVDTNYRLCRLNSTGEAELSNSLEILTVDEGGYPVYDAWVMVLDQDENIGVLEQWPSGENAHSYSGFTVGVPYTLKAQAPAGYEAPADIPFSIDSNGKLIVNGSPVENGKLVMTMSIASYNLTVPENIEGGTVTVTVNGEPATTARMDDIVCVTYTPAANYRLFSSGAVRADGTGIYVDWSDEFLGFTFRMPAQSVTLPTEFRRTLTGVDFVLPDFIQIIEDNAFEGAKMTAVYVPDGCEAIGAEAFKNCTSLTQIRLPRFCSIDNSAFTGCGTLYVFAPAGGTTEDWCQNRTGIVFVAE